MFPRKWQVQDPETGGTGNSGGGGGTIDPAKLQSQLDALVKGMTILADGLTKMDERIEVISKGSTNAKPPTSAPTNQPTTDDLDLDSLGNKELAAVTMSRTMKALEEGPLAKLMEQLTGLGEQIAQVRGHVTYKDLKSSHDDLDEWSEEIQAELKRNGGLTPQDALLLARAKNPEKAKKLEDARSERQREAEAKDKPTFGGLTPTSTRDASPGEKMSQKDAAETAWQKAVSQYGSALERGAFNEI